MCTLPGPVVYYREYFDTCQTFSAYTDISSPTVTKVYGNPDEFSGLEKYFYGLMTNERKKANHKKPNI